MTLVVTHAKVSGIADDPSAAAAGEILPSDWDASHTLTGTASAAQLNSSVVQSAVNDTNVTGAIANQILTLGWTGTLAAGRLNSNVVQSIVNDTNITGSISAQALTLGWAGTLAAARLNSNVVQGVTNDTNVTGSIAAQNLTLGWSGTLAVGRGGTGGGVASGTLLDNISGFASNGYVKRTGAGAYSQIASIPLTDLNTAAALTLTDNAVATLTLQDASSTQDKLTLGSATSVNLDGLSTGPGGQILFTPNASGGGHTTFDIRGVNALTQLINQGGAINPAIKLADTGGGALVQVPGNVSVGGVCLTGNARAGSGNPMNFHFINSGPASGSPNGAEQSAAINIYGTSTLGDTQNVILFFNGTGTNTMTGTLTATTAGMRLGEIGGSGSLGDGHFTQTETWSINGYAEATFTGTTADGSYTAPTNLVVRLAPNALHNERIVAVFDYNGNLLLGANGNSDGFATHGNGNSSTTVNSIILYPTANLPSSNPPGGMIFAYSGAGASGPGVYTKGSSGTLTRIGAA